MDIKYFLDTFLWLVPFKIMVNYDQLMVNELSHIVIFINHQVNVINHI